MISSSSFSFFFNVIFITQKVYYQRQQFMFPPSILFPPQRQSLSTLFDICLCILNNSLFLLPLNFSALFLMSHYGNEVFISLSSSQSYHMRHPFHSTIFPGLLYCYLGQISIQQLHYFDQANTFLDYAKLNCDYSSFSLKILFGPVVDSCLVFCLLIFLHTFHYLALSLCQWSESNLKTFRWIAF